MLQLQKSISYTGRTRLSDPSSPAAMSGRKDAIWSGRAHASHEAISATFIIWAFNKVDGGNWVAFSGLSATHHYAKGPDYEASFRSFIFCQVVNRVHDCPKRPKTFFKIHDSHLHSLLQFASVDL